MVYNTYDSELNKKLYSERTNELKRLAGNFKKMKKLSLLNKEYRRKAKETLCRRREWDFQQEISEKL